MAMHILLHIDSYNKAVIVTSDGDFAPLVEYLQINNKLRAVLSPQRKTCSKILRKYAKGHLDYLVHIKHILEKKRRP